MTSVIEPIVASGSWTDPATGDIHEQHLTEADRDEFIMWTPGFIAAINSGVLDPWIYEIAAACHTRHLATDGQASPERPLPPAEDTLPLAVIPDAMVLLAGSIQPTNAVGGTRTFVYAGRHYSTTRLIAKCFQAIDTFNPALRDSWLRIEEFGADHFKVRIVTEPPGPGVACGQVLQVKFDSVSHLFVS